MNSALLFLVSLLSLSAGPGYAESKASSICDVLLSSAPKESKTAGYHPYARLVEYYMRSTDTDSSNTAIEKILAAQQFINPLEGLKDSASQQVSIGFEQLRKQVRPDDWPRIQNEVRQLAKQDKVEKVDRDEKKEDSREVFAPHVIFKLTKPAARFSNASWYVVNGRVFLAATSTTDFFEVNHLYIFELLNGKLEEIFTSLTAARAVGAPIWQIINNKVIVTVLSKDGGLFKAELNGSSFVKVEDDGRINFVDDKSFSSIHVIDEKIIVTADLEINSENQKQNLLVYNLNSKKIFPVMLDDFISSEPLIQKIGDKTYLSVVAGERNIYVYDISHERAKRVAYIETEVSVMASPSLYMIDNQLLMAFSVYNINTTPAGEVYLYELGAGQPQLLDRFQTDRGGIISSPSWVKYEDRLMIAIGANFNETLLFDVIDKKLSPPRSINAKGTISNFPVFQKVDGQLLLALADDRDTFLVYEIFKKIKDKKK